ncbi:hypothetical protein ACFU7T_25135 [Streptomyces sp. NPDC057555]|uniref:hypothetical protein n=1 Tax=Streptomyces sp. NPDC057555 TaxID=3346166 RepID=UPI00369AEB50
MSDDTSGDTSYDTNEASCGRPHRSSGSLPSLDTLRRAARWETFAILAVLIVLAFAFS